VGRPLWRGRVCLLYMLLAFASAVFLGSESLGTRDRILQSDLTFPFRRLLRLAGSQRRYSSPPPHGPSLCSNGSWSSLYSLGTDHIGNTTPTDLPLLRACLLRPLPINGNCLQSHYLAMAAVWLLNSRSLPSNGSTQSEENVRRWKPLPGNDRCTHSRLRRHSTCCSKLQNVWISHSAIVTFSYDLCKWPINPVANPNSVYSSSYTWKYLTFMRHVHCWQFVAMGTWNFPMIMTNLTQNFL
jgi:hypothetical protein